MVTVQRRAQKIFTDNEVANLTGICVDHLHNFAKSRHLGFIARARKQRNSADQWLFTLVGPVRWSDSVSRAAQH